MFSRASCMNPIVCQRSGHTARHMQNPAASNTAAATTRMNDMMRWRSKVGHENARVQDEEEEI